MSKQAMIKPEQGGEAPVEIVPRAKLRRGTELLLVARAGGRCEFRGCNEFLYVHALTGETGNFGENGHIVAYREGGRAEMIRTGQPISTMSTTSCCSAGAIIS